MPRQVDPEVAALSDNAVERQVAAALLDDPVDGRKPEASARPYALGGEEGLEDPVDDVGRDAGAGIDDLDLDVVAGRNGFTRGGERPVELEIAGADRQAPTIRHGVAGVDGEIDDDLLQL